MARRDAHRKWFYGKTARKRATKEAKIRSKKSGKKYSAVKTMFGGYWVGTKVQERKQRW